MATIAWLGSSGNWNTGALWSGGVMPGTTDVASISTPGTYAIALSATDTVAGVALDDAAATLTVSGALNLNGGTLTALAGTLDVSGTLTNGTLIPSGASIELSGPAAALLGVTVEGTLDLSGSGTSADVTGLGQSSLTELKIGANTELVFLDPENFDGQMIAMAGGTLLADATDPNNGSLFFGPDTTLVQNAVSTTAQIGPDTETALLGLSPVINEGTLIAAAGTLDLDAQGGAFTGTLHTGGPFNNDGTIEIDAGAAVIDDTNSTLAGLGTIINSGGLLDLRGTLTNTNTTIDVAVAGTFSDLQLDDTVIGGTIEEAGGTLAIGAAWLQAVTLLGTGVAFNTLTIGAGTQFDPGGAPYVLTALPAGYGQIYLNNGVVLANAGIAYAGTQYQVDLFVQGGTSPADRANPVVTLAASTTLNVGAGQILRLDAGETGTLINDAVINVAAGGRLEFDNAATYVGGGTINLAQGATVAFNGGINVVTGFEDASETGIGLRGLTNIVGSGATLVNLGSLNLEGQTISSAGNANFSSFVNEGEVTNGSYVSFAGQNENIGSIGSGVTFDTGASLFLVNQATIDGAEIAGAMRMVAGADIEVYGNIDGAGANGTGAATLILNQEPGLLIGINGPAWGTALNFDASSTVSNIDLTLSGITRQNQSSDFLSVSDVLAQNGATVTFAPSSKIIATTLNGPISILGAPGYWVNQGTWAVTPGADLYVTPYPTGGHDDFINDGLITIAAGGTFDVSTNDSIQDLGSIVGPGGLLRIDQSFSGNSSYSNAGNTIYVGGTTGAPNFEIDNTTLTGGTIVNAGGQFSSVMGRLDDVTYIGTLDLETADDFYGNPQPASLYFDGGTLDSQSVTLGSGADLGLSMSQSFVGARLSLGGELSDTGNTLSFDANTIVNITGSVYMPVGHLLNAGTINIDPGASLDLNDAGAASGPETSEPGTIAIDDGTFSATALNAGQTAILGPDSTLSVSRFDPGSDVVFQAPNTLTIAAGTTFGTGAAVSDFGVGDTIALTGYQDGLLAQYIYGNDGVTHYTNPSITFTYDGETLDVIQSGTTTLAAIPIGPGYNVNGFSATEEGNPPYTVNGYAITYAPPGAPAPSLPVISGTQANQPTTDRVAIDPFANVLITDTNPGAVDTAVVTMIGTVPVGGIDDVGTEATGAFSNLGIGTSIDLNTGYIVTGTPAHVQAALDGLVFTPIPRQASPGSVVATSFTIALSDQFGSVTDTTTSVDATTVEDPLLVSGVASPVYVNNNNNAAQPFHDIVLSDPDNATFTATATLASTTYLSFAKTYGATISATGIWSTSGSLAFVQTALQGLIAYVGSVPPGPTGTTATTTMTMSINDGAADTVTSVSTIDIVSGGSVISGGVTIIGAWAGQTTSDQTPVDPCGVIVEDSNVGVVDTVTVTMSNTANGTFSDAVGGTVNGGTFTMTGTPNSAAFGLVQNVDTALAALVFTPTRGQVPSGQSVTTWFTIVANDGIASATDASASVIATDEGGQLSISGAQANQELTSGIVLQPLSGVTIADSTPSAIDTATVTLSNPVAGTLIAANGGTVGSNGVFQITGALAAVQAALQAVGFTPAAATLGQTVSTGLTISVTDGTLNATNTTTSLDLIGTGAAGTIVPNQAVAALTSTGPALTAGSGPNSFVLNLGTVRAGTVEAPVTLDALNIATAPADALDGSFSINNGGGFNNNGFAGFTTLAAGGTAVAGTVTLQTTSAGSFSETITLTPADVSSSGTVVETGQTVTVEAVVVPTPAVEVLNSPTTIALPNVHVGATDQQTVSISNGATAPAATLSVMPVVSGQATATGSIAGLAAGTTDLSDLAIGIDTSAAGARAGDVTLNGTSFASGTSTVLANPQTIAVSGGVFRLASGTVAPVSTILHVGDSGTLALSIVNTAINDGYSEALIASLGAVSGVAAGGSGPTGDIAAGGTNASLSIVVPTATAGTDDGTATVDLVSDGGTGAGGIDGLGTTSLGTVAVPVSVTVDNAATAGVSASSPGLIPTFLDVYTLDLGTVTAGTASTAAVVDALNAAAGPADALDDSFSVSNGGAFVNAGFANITSLAAGGTAVAGTLSVDTTQTGVVTETIVVTPTGVNASGYSQTQTAQTIDVVATVLPAVTLPPANLTLNSPGTIAFPNVRVGTPEQQTISVSNSATPPADALDVTPSASGAATVSGAISNLAAGATDATDIVVGLNTGTAGQQRGTVTLAGSSVIGGGSVTPLAGGPTIAASGTVYREAAPALLPLVETVHVGDPGTIALPVANADPADGFSESLIAMLAGAGDGLGIASAGPSPDIAAGQTNSAALALSFSTALAGTIAGTATVALTSDGGTGADSIDGLGTAVLTTQTVAVDIAVDNFAALALSSDGALTQSGADAYVLNLGTAVQGTAALSADLSIGNSATSAADWLNGGFSASGAAAFNNTGFVAFGSLAAGASLTAGGVSLATSQTGVFSETLSLTPTDANASGYSSPLAQRTITVTGTIDPPSGSAPSGTAQGDVHMVTYDGLHYDFQAVGDFVLTRSTVPGDTFQIQIVAAAAPALGAVSVTTEVAAQVGADVVSFAIGRGDVVWVDGAPDPTLSAADPVQTLAGGALTELSPTAFQLTWATGETLNVTDSGAYLNSAVALPTTDAPGSVQGLLGGDSGQANDFQLPDGTVLARPLSQSEMLGTFADAWRGDALLTAAPMQFLYSAAGETLLQATASGQVLQAGAGIGALSDADGFGATFLGTLAQLADTAISGFSAKDVIDVSDLNAAAATARYAGGMLTVSDGTHSGAIQLAGSIGAAAFQVTTDGHGGALIGVG